MKTCNRCGAPLAEDARFCGNCGAQVETTSYQGSSQQVSASQEPSQAQGNPYQQQPYNQYAPGQGGSYQNQNPYGAPGGYYQAPQPGQPVSSSTYLVLSILALLFCLPLGIPAIIFATKIDRANQEARYQDAAKAAKTCKILLIVAGSLLAAVIVLYILFVAIFAGFASASWYY